MTQRRRGRKPLDQETLKAGRARLVAAARKLFGEQGVENVSVRRLTTETGMSPMSFYRYFPNKRAILIHIWNDIFTDLFARCDAAAGSHPPREALLVYCQTFVAYWLDHRDHYLMVYCQPDVPEPGEDFFAQSTQVERALTGLHGMICAAGVDPQAAQGTMELVICALHGVCQSLITIPEMNWSDPDRMTRNMIGAIVASACR